MTKYRHKGRGQGPDQILKFQNLSLKVGMREARNFKFGVPIV